jgi:hypothetical protein
LALPGFNQLDNGREKPGWPNFSLIQKAINPANYKNIELTSSDPMKTNDISFECRSSKHLFGGEYRLWHLE